MGATARHCLWWLALAAVIALGHPVHQPRRLQRRPVPAFTTVDRVDGTPFPG